MTAERKPRASAPAAYPLAQQQQQQQQGAQQ